MRFKNIGGGVILSVMLLLSTVAAQMHGSSYRGNDYNSYEKPQQDHRVELSHDSFCNSLPNNQRKVKKMGQGYSVSFNGTMNRQYKLGNISVQLMAVRGGTNVSLGSKVSYSLGYVKTLSANGLQSGDRVYAHIMYNGRVCGGLPTNILAPYVGGLACRHQYDPVCATLNGNNKTYSNSCEAGKVGAKILYNGTCKLPPVVCATNYDPVCAQPPMPHCPVGGACIQVMPDQKTYQNRCFADQDGAKFQYNGACTTYPRDTDVSVSVRGFNNGGDVYLDHKGEAYLTQTIYVRNISSSPAKNVTLVNSLPRGASLSRSSIRPTSQATADGRNHNGTRYSQEILTWRLGTLAPGDEKKITVTVKMNSAGRKVSDVSIRVGSSESNISNNKDSIVGNVVNEIIIDLCPMNYDPVCAQPPFPYCPVGGACIQVMPQPKTYSNKCEAERDGAKVLYYGSCGTKQPYNDLVPYTPKYVPSKPDYYQPYQPSWSPTYYGKPIDVTPDLTPYMNLWSSFY